MPTARAIRYLGENRLEEALGILVPPDARKPFDLSVSPPVVGRLAVMVEKRLLPVELPEALQAVPDDAEPPPPGGAAWRLSPRGQRRIQEAYALPDPQRGAGMLEAVADLRAARERDPKAFRADYHLGEALLAAAEFARDRERPLDPAALARVVEAEGSFRAACEKEGPNPYSLHYLARCALLQRRFDEADRLWREALQGFEKFPEARYGLGQALLARGRDREARGELLGALLSDLHLLRERVADLARIHRAHPELFAEPPAWPLWAAPGPAEPSGDEAVNRPETNPEPGPC